MHNNFIFELLLFMSLLGKFPIQLSSYDCNSFQYEYNTVPPTPHRNIVGIPTHGKYDLYIEIGPSACYDFSAY